MQTTLEFPDLLRLIDDRAQAFRAVVAAAPDLDAQVPTCPDWKLRDLVHHLGSVHRTWAGVVAAGPADERPDLPAEPEPASDDRETLLAWSADSTRDLLDALRAAGPEAACWTWWRGSQTSQTAGGVARHQVQEATVHTYDAHSAAGAAQPPLPAEAAVDGVEEFLFTCVATPSAWPHEPATIDFHVTEGRAWRLTLSAAGAQVARLREDGDSDKATLATRSTAGELVLAFYSRIPIADLQTDGDPTVFQQLKEWEPED